jgi:hypothetical protein
MKAWILAEQRRIQSLNPGGVKNLYFPITSRPALGWTQLPIQWAPGILSPGVKLPRRGSDHSLATSAQVRKTWIYAATSTMSSRRSTWLSTGTTLPLRRKGGQYLEPHLLVAQEPATHSCHQSLCVLWRGLFSLFSLTRRLCHRVSL